MRRNREAYLFLLLSDILRVGACLGQRILMSDDLIGV